MAPRSMLARSADRREGLSVWAQNNWWGSRGIERRALWDKSLEAGPPAWLRLKSASLRSHR